MWGCIHAKNGIVFSNAFNVLTLLSSISRGTEKYLLLLYVIFNIN